jgi:Na+/citrate or Na+/malate symporter
LPTVLVGIGTAAGVLFYEVVGFLLGQVEQPLFYTIKVPLLTGLYGAVLTPIVYPLIRRICERSRPRRVAHI